ncbi:MAG: hypothetical protein H6667_16255 [Ardenticatenaceae bacterium]|nr:hypothetical protein [Ardenticatenaceae bacterium]MCB9443613.1 hypothetical protein [Ardenticatenaceae bacterium]
MKSSTFTGILLTFVMLLLVAVAAFFFLFARQRELVNQTSALTAVSDTLRQDLAETGLALTAAEGTREATGAALATAQANEMTLAGELVKSDEETAVLQSNNETLTNQLADATAGLAELQIENETLKAQFPFIKIVKPEANDVLPPDEPVDVLVVVYDPAGITAVNLTLDGQPTTDLDGQDEPVFVHQQSWRPTGTGEHTISVMAINTAGKAAEPQEITFQLINIDALNAQIRQDIETAVIDLSGLSPLAPIEPTLLTREQLGVRLDADFAEVASPEAVRRDVLTLSAFDFVAADYDLSGALVDLYSQGVLGFYDAETAEFVVVSDDEVLGFNEQLTHAHEFVHALQDQNYDLERLNDVNLDSDAAVAFRALVEGHASLIEGLYLASSDIPPEAVADIVQEAQAGSQQLSDFPAFLVNDISFPYTAGFDFVLALYQQGGLAAIDDAWNNLPQSTEQILHPEQYLAGDTPQIVALPPLTTTLGAGWEQLDEDTFGEFYLRQYLSQQLDANSVELAASGWDGDRYAVYWNESDDALVMVLRLAWDSDQDKAEFAAIFPQYPAYLFAATDETRLSGLQCVAGAADVICLGQVGSDSLVVRAPDSETAVRIFEQFREV